MGPAGELVAEGASQAIEITGDSNGSSEQNPEDIWEAIAAASVEVVSRLPDGAEVAAVCLAAQSGSVIGVDSSGHGSRSITWMDTRSRNLVEAWDDERKALIRARSGWSPAPGLGLPTIAWLNSEQLSATRWSSVDDYVMVRLCGQWLTNPSNAAGMQLMDVATLRWSYDLCGIAGVSAEQLSTLLPSGEVVGSVQPGVAEVTGLRQSTRVVMGGHDQACAAFGLDITERGETVLSLGTAWVLTIVVDEPVVDTLPDSVNLSPGVVADRWSASRYLGGLGAEIARTTERFGPDAPESAAVMKACISVVREALDLAAEAGLLATSVVLVGGGTRIERLVEGLADALDLDITVRADASWPALGAAKLAAHALGWQGGAMETSSI